MIRLDTQLDSPEGLVCLPNGWEVHASSASEAHFLYREIFEEHSYLQHGIGVQQGDVIVDVGANIGVSLHAIFQINVYLSVHLDNHLQFC